MSGCAVGRLTDEHPVDRRRRLQPGSRVDHVAGRHPLARLRSRTERDQRLPAVHRDANVQLLLLAHPVANRQRRPHRPFRIVLVRERRAEQRHHGIADELLDCAAVALQLLTQPRVVRRKQRAHVFGIHLLCARRETNQIGEEDSDDLPFLASPGRRDVERSPARTAEAEALRILLPARRTDHAPSVGFEEPDF